MQYLKLKNRTFSKVLSKFFSKLNILKNPANNKKQEWYHLKDVFNKNNVTVKVIASHFHMNSILHLKQSNQ